MEIDDIELAHGFSVTIGRGRSQKTLPSSRCVVVPLM
jgi:hypothetical protein